MVPRKQRALSQDARDIIIRLSLFFRPYNIMKFTGVSLSTVYAIIQWFRLTGLSTPPKRNHLLLGRKRLLSLHDIQFLIGTLRHTPDLYLDEMQDLLKQRRGITVSLSTIWRSLQRTGLTMKRMSKRAAERSLKKHLKYLAKIGGFDPNQLVFVDESSVDRRTSYRGFAWSLSGTEAFQTTFFICGKRFSILPALSLSGFLYMDVLEGSFTSSSFCAFIKGLLDVMNPYPGPNSVIVMDNCNIHKNQEILEMIEACGMRYVFLPPYSPDLNPIECAFSAIKAYIRCHGEELRTIMMDNNPDLVLEAKLFLLRAIGSITASDAEGWFSFCNYL